MTPLREHLLADMQAKKLPEETQKRYVLEVATLTRCCRKSPDLVAGDELTEFLSRRQKELSSEHYAMAVDAIKFFFTETLGRAWRPPTTAEPKSGSELRRRMIQDMRIRNLSPKTQEEYIRWVRKFAEFWGRSPAKLGAEEIRTWLVHLVENEKKSTSTYKVAAASLRFVYVQTLG